MKSTWVRFLVLAIIGFAIGAAMALFQANRNPGTEKPAPVAEIVKSPETVSTAEMMAGVPVGGAFSLIDHKGNAVTEKSWPGKHKLVFFGFTHCADICPAALQKISALMESYDAKGEKIVPLFITVDPERDTKEAMAAYIGAYNANIAGLTGSREQIDDVINSYKVFAAKVPDGHEYMTPDQVSHLDRNVYMVDHSGYIYLMSPDDKLLETFDAGETAEGMIAKVRARLEAPLPVPATP